MIHPKCPQIVTISAYNPRCLGGAELCWSEHPAAEVASVLARLRAAGDGYEYRLSPWQWYDGEGAKLSWDLICAITRSLGE